MGKTEKRGLSVSINRFQQRYHPSVTLALKIAKECRDWDGEDDEMAEQSGCSRMFYICAAMKRNVKRYETRRSI